MGIALGALVCFGLLFLWGYPGRTDRSTLQEAANPIRELTEPSERVQPDSQETPQPTSDTPVLAVRAPPLPASPSPAAESPEEKGTSADVEASNPSMEVPNEASPPPPPASRVPSSKSVRTRETVQQSSPGALKVTASPGTDVYLDGTRVGKATVGAPLNLTDVQPGQKELRLVDPASNASWETEVKIKPGETTQVSHTFRFGTLAINTPGWWGSVYIDGKERGETPAKIERIPAGKHQVKIVRQGRPEVIKEVDILPDQVVRISVSEDGHVETAGQSSRSQ